MSHDPLLQTFKGFDEHSSKRIRTWLDKNYAQYRMHADELLTHIELANTVIGSFYQWVSTLKSDLKLYLQYRYILRERSLINKFITFIAGEEEDTANFFKKLFALETELGVLMAATKKNVELLLQGLPHVRLTLEEIHDLLESLTHPTHIDTSKSENDILDAARSFINYTPPFEYVDVKFKEACTHIRKKGNSLEKILDYHHQQLIILAQENGSIIVTDTQGNRYDLGASEIKKIKKVVEKFKEKHAKRINPDMDKAA